MGTAILSSGRVGVSPALRFPEGSVGGGTVNLSDPFGVQRFLDILWVERDTHDENRCSARARGKVNGVVGHHANKRLSLT